MNERQEAADQRNYSHSYRGYFRANPLKKDFGAGRDAQNWNQVQPLRTQAEGVRWSADGPGRMGRMCLVCLMCLGRKDGRGEAEQNRVLDELKPKQVTVTVNITATITITITITRISGGEQIQNLAQGIFCNKIARVFNNINFN